MKKPINGDYVPTGVVLPFRGGTIPLGYLPALGQRVSKESFKRLFETLRPAVKEFDEKFVVPNSNDQYILGEVPTNKTWINGQRIYRYGYSISALPNNTETTYDLSGDISPQEITSIFGITQTSSAYFSLPRPDNATTATAIELQVDLGSGVDLKVRTRWNASAYSAYIFVEYTKSDVRDSNPIGIVRT